MIHVDTRHPPGVVGLTCGELARFTEFHACFDQVASPPGSIKRYGVGYDTASNSNDIIRQMRPTDAWVWIMDDDHAFCPDALIKLLDRDVPVVVPLYQQRRPPFWPVAYSTRHENGTCQNVTFEELAGKTGLFPIVSAGKAGVLIRRDVLVKLAGADCVCPYDPATGDTKKMEHEAACPWRLYPFFEHKRLIGEDHEFFRKVLDAGFPLYVDLDVPLEHITPFKIRPHRAEDGTWCPEVHLYNNVSFQLWVQATDPPGGV